MHLSWRRSKHTAVILFFLVRMNVQKNSTLSKFLLVALPTASIIASLFGVSGPFAVLNAILSGYFIYLIITNWKRATKVQWAVVVAMFLFLVSISMYIVLAKISINFFLLYANLWLSVTLFIPLVALLIYVSLRFREIILERVNIQLEKTQQLEAINIASAKFVPSIFLNFLGKKNILDATLGDYMEKQVTVLFSDIRDYSALSEKMTPEENFRFVNDFNQRMGPIIQKHNGFVNQYLGDGIMAIFPENTEDTLQAAIGMQKELSSYNQTRIAENKPSIRMGIGLHSGALIMGIIGDDQRMDAATISDTVNTASRIESLTKYFKVNILLSEESLNQVRSQAASDNGRPPDLEFNVRFLGRVKLKGKKEPLGIYECFDGDIPASIEMKQQSLPHFIAGMDHYLSKRFEKAASEFEKVLEIHQEDRTAQFFLNKTTSFLNNGVPEDWTGVEVMTFK